MDTNDDISNVEDKKARMIFDLYQLQIEGLKKGWLIYPKTLNPLTLIIKRKSKVTLTRLDVTP